MKSTSIQINQQASRDLDALIGEGTDAVPAFEVIGSISGQSLRRELLKRKLAHTWITCNVFEASVTVQEHMWRHFVLELLTSIVALVPKEARRTSRLRHYIISNPKDLLSFINSATDVVPVALVLDGAGNMERLAPQYWACLTRIHESLTTRVTLVYVNTLSHQLNVPRVHIEATSVDMIEAIYKDNLDYAVARAKKLLVNLRKGEADTNRILRLWRHHVESVYNMVHSNFSNFDDLNLFTRVTWIKYLEPCIQFATVPDPMVNSISDIGLTLAVRNGLLNYNSRNLAELQGELRPSNVGLANTAKYLVLGAALAALGFARRNPGGSIKTSAMTLPESWNVEEPFKQSAWIACAQWLYATYEGRLLEANATLYRQIWMLQCQGLVVACNQASMNLPLGTSGKLWKVVSQLPRSNPLNIGANAMLNDSGKLCLAASRQLVEAIARDLKVDLAMCTRK